MASPWDDIPGFVDVLHNEGNLATFTLRQGRARMRYLVEWASRTEAIQYILGREEVIDPTSSTPAMTIVRPKTHPHFDWMYAKSIDVVEPMGPCALPADEAEEVEYTHCVLEVEYETMIWDDLDTPRKVTGMTGGVEVMQVGEFAWQFSSGQRFPAPLGINVQTVDYKIMLPRHPRIPPLIFSAVGRVNASAITDFVDGVTFAAGTLLLGPVTAQETYDSFGNVQYNLEYPFKWREVNHNHEFNPYTGAFEEVSHPTTSRKKYLTADFSQIFI